jgi:GMP synthase-like glutamine amidotransferase
VRERGPSTHLLLLVGMSTCLVIQHVASESAFAIEEALHGAGVRIDTRRVYEGDAVPEEVSGLEGVVVMGGPMSAASDDGFPTRRAEIALLQDAIGEGVPVLGVCLGAQLVAAAGGAAVYKGELGPEVGWSSVNLTDECAEDRIFADLPASLTVLQWHGDTFDFPAGAQHLISNPVYPHQAFRIGDVAWGVQFHLEVTEAAVEGFLTAFAADAAAVAGGADGIRSATPAALLALTRHRNLVLGRFAGLVATHVASRDLVAGA